jgi:hypothetical protein
MLEKNTPNPLSQGGFISKFLLNQPFLNKRRGFYIFPLLVQEGARGSSNPNNSTENH